MGRVSTEERRVRLRRPPLLTAIAAFFLLSPIGSYFITAYMRHRSVFDPAHVLRGTHDNALGLTVFLFPLFVGVGLWLVRSWGFWLFLAYTPLLLLFNVREIVARPNLFSFSALGQNVLLFAAIGYVLQKDISAPFFASTPRGWRRAKRVPLTIDVTVEGMTLKTRDLSEGGCFVLWPDCPRSLGEPVKVKFEHGGRTFELVAGVARIDSEGVALAFRALSEDTREALRG